jgi:serine protease Do
MFRIIKMSLYLIYEKKRSKYLNPRIMKQSIKNLFLTLLVPALVVSSAMAQKEDKDKDEKDKKEGEQIIITRKGKGDDKVVVELNGDKVIVNGKELKDDDEGDVTVRRRKIKDVWAFGGDEFPGSWNNAPGFKMYNLNENKAMLGVTTDEVDEGVKIQSVSKQSAAEKSGLKEGDIITKVDDKKIETPDDLSDVIQDHKPGDKVTVTFIRDKKEQKVTAELGKWKGVTSYSYRGPNSFNLEDLEGLKDQLRTMPRSYNYNFNWSGSGPKLGISVQDTEDGKGVNVLDVDSDGNGAKAGIKEDDVITEVDGKAVNSADQIAKVIKESKDKSSVKVKLLRKGKPMTLNVKMPKKLKTADL